MWIVKGKKLESKTENTNMWQKEERKGNGGEGQLRRNVSWSMWHDVSWSMWHDVSQDTTL
jgi:hypothetical protein